MKTAADRSSRIMGGEYSIGILPSKVHQKLRWLRSSGHYLSERQFAVALARIYTVRSESTPELTFASVSFRAGRLRLLHKASMLERAPGVAQ